VPKRFLVRKRGTEKRFFDEGDFDRKRSMKKNRGGGLFEESKR